MLKRILLVLISAFIILISLLSYSLKFTPIGIGFKIPKVFAQNVIDQSCTGTALASFTFRKSSNDHLIQWGCLDIFGNLNIGNSTYVNAFSGIDIGDSINKVNNASNPNLNGLYLNITAQTNGTCYNFSTPIVLTTIGKGVKLKGVGPGATCLNYTGITGTAITIDPGQPVILTGQSSGISDIQLSGTGTGNSATALSLGITNGGEGFDVTNFIIHDFGTAIKLGGSSVVSFAYRFAQGSIYNVNQILNMTVGTENLLFDHVIFQPTFNGGIQANSIILAGPSSGFTIDAYFRGCSFDSAQLVINSPANPPAAYVSVESSHFENPAGNTTNDYIINTSGNLSVSNSTFFQDFSTGSIPSEFITIGAAGHAYLSGNSYSTGQIMGKAVNLTGGGRVIDIGSRVFLSITTPLSTDGNANNRYAYMPADSGQWLLNNLTPQFLQGLTIANNTCFNSLDNGGVAVDCNMKLDASNVLHFIAQNTGNYSFDSGGGVITLTGTEKIKNGTVAFASIGAVPTAGTSIYCTDCTTAATCAGAGTGHMAVSNGTNWTCQ